MNICKEKDHFNIENDGKIIIINMNQQIISFTGRTVKQFPKGFAKTKIKNECEEKRYGNIDDREKAELQLLIAILEGIYTNEELSFTEKMLNVGHYNFYPSVGMMDTLHKSGMNFKQLNKIATQYENDPEVPFYMKTAYYLSSLIGYKKRKELIEKINNLKEYGYSENFISALCDQNLQVSQIDEYLKLFKLNPEIQYMWEMHCVSIYDISKAFCDYYFRCETFDLPLELKNFWKNAYVAKQIEKMRKNEIINKTLQKNQKNEWKYENDDFIVIVPTTYAELEEEAKQQHNCLSEAWLRSYGNYFEKGVQKHGVVFIRQKQNPNTSYITCDFNLMTKRITQYLGKYNRDQRGEKEKSFKKEYQDFLLSL